MKTIEYQKDCFRTYKDSIGYPLEYTYLKGNSINVLVPIETALNNVMIVGAYPSAKFFTVNGVLDVPMSDNDSPFSSESYFDGSRVRTIPSGEELNEVILRKIGVKRSECWITDLVKVFLFKEGHIDRYKKLGRGDLIENRSRFIDYAEKSMVWLYREIEICNPQIIILLGLEVTKVFFSITDSLAKNYLDGVVKNKVINGIDRNIICLPHPGILMKKTDRNPWPDKFNNEISLAAKSEIRRIMQSNSMTPRRILLFTGNGKGKSTAAFGMLARALGHGMKARVIQFVKSDDAVGEQRFFSPFDGVDWEQFGKGFLPRDPESPKMEEHRAAARAGLDAAIAALASPDYDVVLLDELCFALGANLVPIEPLLEALRSAEDGKIVVMTGRNAPEALVAVADTVTEMTMIKHAYQQGIPAQKGIED